MSGALTPFRSVEFSPVDGCSGVTMVIATSTRMEAVQALRHAGQQAGQVAKADPGSPEAEAAMSAPGQILWAEWENADQRYGLWRKL